MSSNHHKDPGPTARQRVPDLIDQLPADGSWKTIAEVAYAMGIDVRFAGRIANIAKRSIISHKEHGENRTIRRIPALCHDRVV